MKGTTHTTHAQNICTDNSTNFSPPQHNHPLPNTIYLALCREFSTPSTGARGPTIVRTVGVFLRRAGIFHLFLYPCKRATDLQGQHRETILQVLELIGGTIRAVRRASTFAFLRGTVKIQHTKIETTWYDSKHKKIAATASLNEYGQIKNNTNKGGRKDRRNTRQDKMRADVRILQVHRKSNAQNHNTNGGSMLTGTCY